MSPERFTVRFPEAAIDDLRARLASTRWPLDPGNEDWRYGTNLDYLKSFVDYWANDFDWRGAERAINRFEHFKVDIDGIPLHFIHMRGCGPDPTPLLMAHGWPWTFWDLAELIGPLSDPGAHGRDAADSFDVVVPSLPGFAFSSPLTRTGIGVGATADVLRTLMRNVLGYERYGAQGGDFGATVLQRLAEQHPSDLIGLHLNRYKRPIAPYTFGMGALTADDYAPDEQDEFRRQQASLPLVISHLSVQGNDPQSLSYGMHDSPAAMAAWMIERRRAWSDCGGDIERVFSRDFLATTFTIYWLTETFSSSVRLYWESAHEAPSPPPSGRVIDAPFAIGVLPHDLITTPRRHAEEDTDLRRWTRFPRGGHFGAAEVPELIVDDLAEFFRPLRGQA